LEEISKAFQSVSLRRSETQILTLVQKSRGFSFQS